ncbi:MAG TPA: hypothetical protein VE974_01315 [Thermoanaerobaculia bacterium]|nr:hypothetical protein [Thermoanaerobaculia bacterium]
MTDLANVADADDPLDWIETVERWRAASNPPPDYEYALAKLMAWMRPRTIRRITRTFWTLSGRIDDEIDGMLSEFIMSGGVAGYLAYRQETLAGGGEPVPTEAYFFGGRRTNLTSFFRSHIFFGTFGASPQRVAKAQEAVRKAIRRGRKDLDQLIDFRLVDASGGVERWERRPFSPTAGYADYRILRFDLVPSDGVTTVGPAQREQEERLLELARMRRGSLATLPKWPKWLASMFDQLPEPFPLKPATFLELARIVAEGAEVSVDLIGEMDEGE